MHFSRLQVDYSVLCYVAVPVQLENCVLLGFGSREVEGTNRTVVVGDEEVPSVWGELR